MNEDIDKSRRQKESPLTEQQLACDHKAFLCTCDINRVEGTEEGVVKEYVLETTVQCKDCGAPFRFVCKDVGISFDGAAVSLNSGVLAIPIKPGLKTQDQASFKIPNFAV